MIEPACNLERPTYVNSDMPDPGDPRKLRDLAERCLRLSRMVTNPKVAESLTLFAARYLDLAERAASGRDRRDPPRDR